MTTSTTETFDPLVAEAFAGKLMGLYTGGMITSMVDIGHRTGLFEAATGGPATSQELADRAGLQERYVREWLGAMVTSGIFDYDPATRNYRLPAAHATVLVNSGAGNMAPMSQLQAHLGKHLAAVVRAFREGGGVPYDAFRPEFTDVMDAVSRDLFDVHLIDHVLPVAPGLVETLTRGARAADVGCGTGHAVVLMARAFPESTFVGYDLAEDAIDQARGEAAAAGLTNATFEVRDVAALAPAEPFDAIVSFDTIHDQVDPVAVLASIHRALAPRGTYLMAEPYASSNLEDNVANPMAPMLYAISTLHCLTVSLAHGGAGLGTAFGEQKARELLAGAGFGEVTVIPSPADPGDAIYLTSRSAGSAVAP